MSELVLIHSTFGQELRKKRMDLGLQIEELARLLNVTPDTIINWELRNVKPVEKNLTMVREFLDSKPDARLPKLITRLLKDKLSEKTKDKVVSMALLGSVEKREAHGIEPS